MTHKPQGRVSAGRLALGSAVALAALAYANHRVARQAEHDNPPQGRFLTIDGVRLHYVERGSGPALVLIHGNGSMVELGAAIGPDYFTVANAIARIGNLGDPWEDFWKAARPLEAGKRKVR